MTLAETEAKAKQDSSPTYRCLQASQPTVFVVDRAGRVEVKCRECGVVVPFHIHSVNGCLWLA